MIISKWIITLSWLAFLIFWTISAISVKKDLKRNIIGRFINIARVLGGVFLVVFIIHDSKSWDSFFNITISVSPLLIYIVSSSLCFLGVILVIWARWHLGRNWSSHPSVKIDHELVTSGPYKTIRNPIYTGMLMAVLGQALVSQAWFFIVFITLLAVFLFRVKTEEKLMMQTFPDEYPKYKERTSALIPLI